MVLKDPKQKQINRVLSEGILFSISRQVSVSFGAPQRHSFLTPKKWSPADLEPVPEANSDPCLGRCHRSQKPISSDPKSTNTRQQNCRASSLPADVPAIEAYPPDDISLISSLAITHSHAVKSPPLPYLASSRFHFRAATAAKITQNCAGMRDIGFAV